MTASKADGAGRGSTIVSTVSQGPGVTTPGPQVDALSFSVPEELIERVAARVADLVTASLDQSGADSPWLDFDGALAYTGFTRDKLYKLTAAKAIPFRKKEGGQRLLFHKPELDGWLESLYPRQDRLA
jgi:excisionase family DNA binding protein